MFVLSLISSPERPALSDALVETVASALNHDAKTANWLAEGIACDLPLFEEDEAAAIAAVAAVRAIFSSEPVDFNLVPADRRRKQLLIADMDSTMIHQECIDELGIAAGAGEHIKEVTRRAMRGELDFVEALNERVSFMKGLPESAIRKVIDEIITFVPGGRTLVSTMKVNGAYCALISGGFVQFTGHVAKECGFHTHQANQLIIEEGRLTGHVVQPALGSAAKLEALNRLTAEHDLELAEALAVGDGANDVAMLQAAGMGVAIHAKPAVRDAAQYVIDHGDLTALLYLQGYHRTEFVSS